MVDDAAFVWDSSGRRRPAAAPHPAAPPPAAPAPGPEPVPDGHLMIPVAAWDKMLAQLGNLHEAGQQLADARERAAKAETEVAFLRERLAEMRDRRPDPPEERKPDPEPQPAPEPATLPGRWLRRVRSAADALRGVPPAGRP